MASERKYRVWIEEVTSDGEFLGYILVAVAVIFLGIFFLLYEILAHRTSRIIFLSILGLVIVAAVIISIVTAATDPLSGQSVYYTLSDDGTHYYVSGLRDQEAVNVTIAATFNEKPVKYINDSAFKDKKKLEKVVIEDGILTIGNSAFQNCTALKSVTLPDTLKNLGESAFEGSGIRSITIPGSVTSIGKCAFAGCEYLQSVTFKSGIKSIGDRMFYSCDSLTSVIIPDGVISIKEYAFSFCDSLSTVSIPTSVTSIDNHVFGYCGKLTTIEYKGTKAQWNKISKVEGKYDSINGCLDWNYCTGKYTVKCSDGNLEK